MFSAFLDTCVLVPSLQRDVILEVGCAGAFRPVWSNRVEDELVEVLQRLRTARGIGIEESDRYSTRLLSQMNRAFPDARVCLEAAGVDLVPGCLPDPADAHVVLAAVTGRADVIVTHNLRDFPDRSLPNKLFAQAPDEFLLDLLSLNPPATLEAVLAVSRRTGVKGPHLGVGQILEHLSGQLPGFTKGISDYRKAIRKC